MLNMFKAAKNAPASANYDDIYHRFEGFEKEYNKIYPLYESLMRADFRLSQNFWRELMQKLYQLEQLFFSIENDIKQVDVNLQQSFEQKQTDARKKLNAMVNACCQDPHIQKNWVRIRVWGSGYFDAQDKFIEEAIARNIPRHIASNSRANVGHASLETATGYMSFWPGHENGRYFNSLYEDLRDEGPDAEKSGAYFGKRPRNPDYMITFYSLDASKMDDFCREYVRSQTIYGLKGKSKSKTSCGPPVDNCITACMKILASGGIKTLWPEKDFVYDNLPSPSPAYFAEYLKQVKNKENEKYPMIRQLTAANVDKPINFKPSEIRLTVTESYIAKNTNELSINHEDEVFLEEILNESYLLCYKKIDGRHGQTALVPRSCFSPVIEEVAAATNNNNSKPTASMTTLTI